MNDLQKKAIQDAIDNVEDNLYRARLAQNRNPLWTSGNGEPIADVIAGYENRLKRLRANS